jgi:magnesium-transporting ATPase (P-type)
MTFNTMVWFSIFHVFNAHSDERSAFVGLFTNKWLWGSILLAITLQAAVIYIPLSAAGVFNRAAYTRRLVALHWCGEFGSLAA